MSPTRRLMWTRFVRVVRGFVRSEVGWRAIGLFALLIALLLSVSGLNVVNSYVGRDFMTAITERDWGGYRRMAILYLGVFAASTIVAVFYRFTEESLGLLWREWLTRRLLSAYLRGRAYYRLNLDQEVDNPDQRISEDVKTFTVTTLSFLLMLLNGSITALAFAGVLWSINPLLFLVSLCYAAFGSLATILLGRRLVGLDYRQLEKEANFRFELIHVRENAEPIAMRGVEGVTQARLLRRLDELVANFRTIIGVRRNLGFFTTGYNYLIQIIPVLIVAPLFLRGEVEFGVVTQSAMAFSQILGAFSLIVTQFGQISTYAAVLSRLDSLGEAIDRAGAAGPEIEIVADESRVAFEGLTLRAPNEGRTLVEGLSISIPIGRRLLVLGSDDAAKGALSRATAGLWVEGEGRILRPIGPGGLMILPERPYTEPSTLRDQFRVAGAGVEVTEDRILEALEMVEFDPLLDRLGGLDVEHEWSNALSIGEQQLLALARLIVAKPRFALLDRVWGTLGHERAEKLYRILSESEITYISVANRIEWMQFHDEVLELQGDGQWERRSTRDAAGA